MAGRGALTSKAKSPQVRPPSVDRLYTKSVEEKSLHPFLRASQAERRNQGPSNARSRAAEAWVEERKQGPRGESKGPAADARAAMRCPSRPAGGRIEATPCGLCTTRASATVRATLARLHHVHLLSRTSLERKAHLRATRAKELLLIHVVSCVSLPLLYRGNAANSPRTQPLSITAKKP